jgi:hypothetical protein
LGLPVFPANRLFPSPEILAEPICQHQTAQFITSKLTAVDSVRWYISLPDGSHQAFGNTSTLQVTLSQYGNHQIDLVYYRGDYPDTSSLEFYVYPVPSLSLPLDTAICPGASISIDPSIPWMTGDTTLSFLWNDGSTSLPILINKEGKYVLTLDNECGSAKDSISVSFRKLPAANLGPDTLLCSGTVIDFSVGEVYPDTRVLSNTGDTNPHIQVTDVPRVSVMMTDVCGQAHDEIKIDWEKLPSFSLPERYDLCPGEQATLKAGPELAGIQYAWENGMPGPLRSFTNEGDFWVEMQGNICKDTAAVRLERLAPPVVSLGPDTILCMGERVYLDASFDRSNYLWNTGSTAASFWVDNADTYHVTVTNRCGVRRDTIQVEVVSAPFVDLGPDTVICQYASLILDARIPPVSLPLERSIAGRTALKGEYDKCSGQECILLR